MNKAETNKLLNKIKGYYNSQFFIDDFILDAWYEQLKSYELEDTIEHLQKYLKEFPEVPPKPHTFKKGLYTREERQKMKNADYIVQCNLCERWMPLSEYDSHYGRCLDIEYLVNVAKTKGEDIKREDIENCRQDVIDKLLKKYEPKRIENITLGNKNLKIVGG
jgi:hypothetical protein